MSTSDIIAAISTTIAAASLALTYLQYRVSRTQNRTETSRRAEQYRNLDDLSKRATSQAETAKMIVNSTVRGAPVNIENLRALAEASGELAAELSAEAECARPVPSGRRYALFRR